MTSVTATLEPYIPQISDQGIPAEQVNFTVRGLPTPSKDLYLHCDIAVRHSGTMQSDPHRASSRSVVAGSAAVT